MSSYMLGLPLHSPCAGAETVGRPITYAVSCPHGFGELRDPRYFETFGAWQTRYGRDNLGLSGDFLSLYQEKVAPSLEEALQACPAFVLETMMNAMLKVETDGGPALARAWLLQIYDLRDRSFAVANEENRERLLTLQHEWDVDIAAVYPKFLDVERLGPFPAWNGAAQHADSGRQSSPSEARLQDEAEQHFCNGLFFYLYSLEPTFYKPGVFYCLQGQWGTEVVMHHYLRHNCRTTDPEMADWFYVPLYATCRYVTLNEDVRDDPSDMQSIDSASSKQIWEPLLDFLKKSKYYQRRQGKDHIFLFADGQGPRIWDSYDIVRSESVFMSPESKCPTWGEPVRRYVDLKPCLTSWKDIIIPGHTDYARIEYLRKQSRPTEDRRLLMTFHGRAPGTHAAYGDCAVRGAIMGLVKHGPHVDVGGFVGDYPERKGDSHFCLVPAGTSPWTNHLYESFYAGCIPVILSDEYEVAFLDELQWQEFSIKWPEAEVGDSLYRYLHDLTQYYPNKVASMKANVERNACWFNWYSVDLNCNPYLLIQRRLKRLLQIRTSRPRFWNCDGEAVGNDSNEPPLVFAHLRRPTRFKGFPSERSNFTYLSPWNADAQDPNH